jgi:alpha-D-xyloside xylohydrolase
MAEAHTDGQPVMRPVFHGFPDDPVAWELDDQYLFGPDLLVAPVTRAGARSRAVYLPAAVWYDAWTGQPYDGGGWVEVAAPLERIPVLTRDEALLAVFAA